MIFSYVIYLPSVSTDPVILFSSLLIKLLKHLKIIAQHKWAINIQTELYLFVELLENKTG